jgi:hypothetical protein
MVLIDCETCHGFGAIFDLDEKDGDVRVCCDCEGYGMLYLCEPCFLENKIPV